MGLCRSRPLPVRDRAGAEDELSSSSSSPPRSSRAWWLPLASTGAGARWSAASDVASPSVGVGPVAGAATATSSSSSSITSSSSSSCGAGTPWPPRPQHQPEPPLVKPACRLVRAYHQTSPAAAAAILATGRFRRGPPGFGGRGIYFAAEPQATHVKANARGVILECLIDPGRVRVVTHAGDWGSRWRRALHRCDSVVLTFLEGGIEFVLYSSARVKAIQVAQVLATSGSSASIDSQATSSSSSGSFRIPACCEPEPAGADGASAHSATGGGRAPSRCSSLGACSTSANSRSSDSLRACSGLYAGSSSSSSSSSSDDDGSSCSGGSCCGDDDPEPSVQARSSRGGVAQSCASAAAAVARFDGSSGRGPASVA